MTVEIVTVEEVNLALRLDLQEDDPREIDVESKIAQASEAVLDYLKVDIATFDESTINERMKAAVILVVGSLLDDSKAELLSGLGTGDPKNPVVALLYRMRDPALA